MDVETKKEFALRCDNWVIWNLSDWNDGGWIQLCVTNARSKPGVSRSAFRLVWNGERFTRHKEVVRLKLFDRDAEQILTSYLARALPCPMVTA